MSYCIIRSKTENIIEEVSEEIRKKHEEWAKQMDDNYYLKDVIHQIANGCDVSFKYILKGYDENKKDNEGEIDNDTGYYKAGYLNIVLLKRKVFNDIKKYNESEPYKACEYELLVKTHEQSKKKLTKDKELVELAILELEALKNMLDAINY